MALYDILSEIDDNTKKAMSYIKEKCLKNGINNPTQFTHKNGAVVTVTPCTPDLESQNWDDVDFFLAECADVYLPGYSQLSNLANVLLYLDEVIKNSEERKKELAKFRERLETMEECEDKEYQKQMYSDAYKSCYGFRPKWDTGTDL